MLFSARAPTGVATLFPGLVYFAEAPSELNDRLLVPLQACNRRLVK